MSILNLSPARASLGRAFRRGAEALGFKAKGPLEVWSQKPEGAKTVDPARTREAVSSRPVLPRPHPLLEASPIRYPETWVQNSRPLCVYGPTVSVVDEKQRLLGDVSVEWGKKPDENWTFRRFRLPKPREVSGRTLILASTGGNTYFHWMTDVLPRIRLAREAGHLPASFDQILVNGLEQAFQRETLGLLGLPVDRCLVLGSRGSAYRMEAAVLPSLPGIPGVVPPESVQFLRDHFPVANYPARRLFIGRAGARHRRLVEEEKIFSLLKERGFEKLECEKMSVREQAEMFRSADMVVGAHGAALTNLVFCRPGTRVVELFSPRYVNPCYRDLCVAADLRHSAVLGDGQDWSLSMRHHEPSVAITAGHELVEQVLAQLEP